MKTITRVMYVCDVCGTEHRSLEDALRCETLPTFKPSGLKVGDRIESVALRLNGCGPSEKIYFTATVVAVQYLLERGTHHEEWIMAERDDGGCARAIPSYNCKRI